MSLIEILRKKNKSEFFTTPSHSQKFFIFNKLRCFYKLDISETDVHEPQKALESAQTKAAQIYGVKSTFFLTNGSTSGIVAAVLSCVKPGEQVLLWEDAHPCHINAVRLAGTIPVFYKLDKDDEWGIYKKISIEVIENILKENSVKALIVTSPSYDGVVSDIKAIKEVCKKYNTFLIVDEAHGALYPFSDELPESAISQGADFIIQSLHKTAGGLNPTALLHTNIDADIKSSLDMINTTSPSYPLLASIEKNISFLNSPKGRAKISELIKNIEKIKLNLPNLEFYEGDPTKILLKSPNKSGCELSEFLYKNNIEDEKTNDKSTMLLCGIGTTLNKLKKLEKVLKRL